MTLHEKLIDKSYDLTYDDIYSIIMLSFQRALLGAIWINVRAVWIAWNSLKDIKVVYVLDREVMNNDLEEVSLMTGQVYSDFPYAITIKEECICINEGKVIIDFRGYENKAVAFARKE